MITAINSTRMTNKQSFKAHVPNTLGKKACDRMAKQLMEYGNVQEQSFAQKYYASIRKIKHEKEIDEVLICATNKSSSIPYISADGYHVRTWGIPKMPAGMTPKEQRTYQLMDCVNFAADTLENVVISINAV